MSTLNLTPYRALAERLATAAAAVTRPAFRTPLRVEEKDDASPVTQADREAEAAMRRLLEAEQPDHGILGEEQGTARLDAEYLWVLDPIDGTKAFISGQPTFGTLIALLHNGKPMIGVIDQPIQRERWIGVAGSAATLNGEPVRTRACATLDRATLYSTAPDMFRGPDEEAFKRVAGGAQLVRYGLDCYAYGLLAAGFIDLVIEAGLHSWDFCALAPIVEGAGGTISDWSGLPLGLESDGRVIAAGDARLHRQALTFLYRQARSGRSDVP